MAPPVIASFYTKPEKRTELTLTRHCEERSDEAIQWPYEMLEKVTGLLRRYAPRNDGFRNDGYSFPSTAFSKDR